MLNGKIEDNERDLAEIPDNIKADLEIVPVRWIDQVLEVALQHQPTPLSLDALASTKGTEKQVVPNEAGNLERH